MWAAINIIFFLALAIGLSFIFINVFKSADRRRVQTQQLAAAQEAPAQS